MADQKIVIVIEGKDGLSPATDKASASLKKLGASAEGAQSGLRGLVSGASAVAIGMGAFNLATQVVTRSLGAIKGMAIDFNATMEQSKIAWGTLLGGATAADAMLEKLFKFAAETPFEFGQVQEASKRLLAMGIAAENVIPLMRDIGNATSALGMSAHGIDRIVLAIGQMNAKTKVSGEEMRQLAEAGIPAWQMLADHIGLTVGETMKLSEAGKISSATFIEAFQKFSQINYGDMMQKQSKTFQGAMSTISDMMTMVTSTAAKPLFEEVSSLVLKFSEFLATEDVKRWAEDTAKSVETVIQTLRDMKQELDVIGQTLSSLTANTKIRSAAEQALAEEQGAANRKQISDLLTMIPLYGDWARAIGGFGDVYADITAPARALNKQLADTAARASEADAELNKIVDTWRRFRTMERAPVALEQTLLSELDIMMSNFDRPFMIDAPQLGDHAYERDVAAFEEYTAAREEALRESESAARSAQSAAESAAKAAINQARAILESAQATAKAQLPEVLLRINPAALSAAAGVDVLRLRLVGLQDQQESLAGSQRNAQDALRGMQDRVNELSASLGDAKTKLSDLLSPRLMGMGAIDDQIFEIEQAIKRLNLAKLEGIAPKTAEADLIAYQKQLNILRLQRETTYEPQLRELQRLGAKPVTEISFEEAAAGIVSAVEEIGNLEGALAGAQDAVRGQEAAVRGLEQASYGLTKALQAQQDALIGQETKQKLVNDALGVAFGWFLKDRQAMVDLGVEGQTQALIVDEKVRALLASVSKSATENTDVAIDNINLTMTEYQGAMSGAILKVNKLEESLKNIPTDIYTYHHIITVYGDEAVPGRAAGGPVYAGQPYTVGERGPELFIPSDSGRIVPNGGTGGIDYTQLAAALANQPIEINLDGERVALAVRRNLQYRGAGGMGN